MRYLTTLVLLFGAASAQTTLYFEAFDNGVMTFDLNTSDMGSAGLGGYNKFIINDNYAGGSGSTTCIFPVTFNVPTTPSQPAGISGSPASKYLHTLSNIAESFSIFNCCFLAADGICSNGENYFSKMNTDISTIGYTGVSLNFWWICQGGANNYGEVYFSIDSGINWYLLASPVAQYKNQGNWTQAVIANPLFDNQPKLRFGFRFVNQVTFSASDPGFGIDDIRITGIPATAPTLTTDTVTGNPLCPGENITVDFTATGSFNSGNIFTAELSDSYGSFANPTVIGTLADIVSGTIPATIPLSAPAGSGYRIRVISSSPAITADDNGTDLTITTVTSVSMGTLEDVCLYDAPFPLSGGSPAGGIYFGPAVSGNTFNPQEAGIGTFNIFYTLSNVNGCSDTASNKITVNPVPAVSFSGLSIEYCSTANPVILEGSPPGGTFTGNGINGSVFNPSEAGIGQIAIKYIYTNLQNCSDSSVQMTTVNVCNGMDEWNRKIPSIYPSGKKIIIENLSNENQNMEFLVLNLLGQEIVTGNFQPASAGRQEIDIDNGGIYLVKLTSVRGEYVRKVLISERF